MQTLRWLKENWLQAAILLIPFIVVAAFWDRFPDRVVVQWNDSGPTKWANKTFGLLLSPVLSVAIGLLLGWIPQLDPKLRRNPEWSERSLGILRLAITTLISFVGILVAVYALGYHFNSAAIGINAVLLFFLVFGNYIGTFPPSYFVGIRTPWTLESDDVWRATHRNAGRIMVLGSLGALSLQFAITREHTMQCFLAFLGASFAWSVFYSYRRFQLEKQAGLPISLGRLTLRLFTRGNPNQIQTIILSHRERLDPDRVHQFAIIGKNCRSNPNQIKTRTVPHGDRADPDRFDHLQMGSLV